MTTGEDQEPIQVAHGYYDFLTLPLFHATRFHDTYQKLKITMVKKGLLHGLAQYGQGSEDPVLNMNNL